MTTYPSHPIDPIFTHPMITQSQNHIFKPKQLHLTTCHPIPQILEPTSISQALKKPKWREATYDELNTLIHNRTWKLITRSLHHNLIGCTWVFRVKHHFDGPISRFKARLVAKGFYQWPGLNYHETFSSVIKLTTIHVVLSFALYYGWTIHQLDVNNAFLYGTLQKDVFMLQPPSFIDLN